MYLHSLKYILFLTIASLTAFAAHSEEMNKASVLEALHTAQEKIQNAQCAYLMEEIPISDSGVIATDAQGTGTYQKWDLTVAGNGVHRFYVSKESSFWWTDKSAFILEREDLAFNGNTGMRLNYRTNPTGNTFSPTYGIITNEPDELFSSQSHYMGSVLLLASFYKGVGLAQYLESIPSNVPEWKVLPSEKENVVRLWHPNLHYSESNPISYIIEVDLEKNGIIIGCERRVGPFEVAITPQGMFYTIRDVSIVEKDGFWLPESYTLTDNFFTGAESPTLYKNASRHTIEWKAINVEETPETFQLVYSDGLEVSRYFFGGAIDLPWPTNSMWLKSRWVFITLSGIVLVTSVVLFKKRRRLNKTPKA